MFYSPIPHTVYVVVRDGNKVLLYQMSDGSGRWTLPSALSEGDETPLDTAVRLIRVGVGFEPELLKLEFLFFRSILVDGKPVAAHVYECPWHADSALPQLPSAEQVEARNWFSHHALPPFSSHLIQEVVTLALC